MECNANGISCENNGKNDTFLLNTSKKIDSNS